MPRQRRRTNYAGRMESLSRADEGRPLRYHRKYLGAIITFRYAGRKSSRIFRFPFSASGNRVIPCLFAPSFGTIACLHRQLRIISCSILAQVANSNSSVPGGSIVRVLRPTVCDRRTQIYGPRRMRGSSGVTEKPAIGGSVLKRLAPLVRPGWFASINSHFNCDRRRSDTSACFRSRSRTGVSFVG